MAWLGLAWLGFLDPHVMKGAHLLERGVSTIASRKTCAGLLLGEQSEVKVHTHTKYPNTCPGFQKQISTFGGSSVSFRRFDYKNKLFDRSWLNVN